MIKIYGFIAVAILLTIGVTLLGKHHSERRHKVARPLTIDDMHSRHSRHLIDAIDAERIKQNLRALTKHPHVAGTDANKRVAEIIQQMWKEAGLEAYAAPGTVTSDVVYVNYGTTTDYTHLKNMGISVKGKIAMMRYGNGFRGNKISMAQQNGAIGAILFSDPEEVAPTGVDPGKLSTS
ncbi:hypothetical protein WR25_26267 [Diploscapter pachys]|uniref:PA domain-containing protein n=1 Tax=Diploscapter pachys TaxID=2018661 RepID=A0A2A2JSY9_9BILA|nr:hypothetical protein WR25_26267 [Diploscapter pachys]